LLPFPFDSSSRNLKEASTYYTFSHEARGFGSWFFFGKIWRFGIQIDRESVVKSTFGESFDFLAYGMKGRMNHTVSEAVKAIQLENSISSHLIFVISFSKRVQ